MNILQLFGLVAIVLLGGTLGVFAQNLNKSNIPKLVLSFGGAYLLGLAFVELLPSVYVESDFKIGIWVLVGFLIQLVLEQLSQGVEHGHLHKHQHSNKTFISVMIGLSIHAFLEGFPLQEGGLMHHHDHANSYFWGIVIHKLPAAFALASVLIASKVNRGMVYFCLLLFSVMTPLGSFVASKISLDLHTQKILLAIVIGLFLHIATTILFEAEQSDKDHHVSWKKLLAIICGFVTVWLV